MDRRSEALKAYIGVKRTSDIFDKVASRDASKHDLTLNEFAVLELLYHKGPQPIQKIKERILVTSSSTTYIIDKLTEKGLVGRQRCSEDRRVIFANLTTAGQQLMEDIFPSHAELIVTLFEDLTVEEINEFRTILKKISKKATSL